MQYLEFDGKARDFIFVGLGATLLSIITFGFGIPWATTMVFRWKTQRTIVAVKA